jgi:transposase
MTRKRRRMSAREFSTRFTKIVSRHLSALPAEEQEKRIRAAARTAHRLTRAERPTARTVEETPAIPLLSRSRE